MASLIDKMRERRESWVKAGKFEFKLRRPTRLQLVKTGSDIAPAELLIEHFHDWKNVVEDDLVGGGGTSAVAFDRALWAEFLSDHPELWPGLMQEFKKALLEYNEQIEASAKN